MLVKKGHVLRTHKERLFVLQGAALRYFRVKKKVAEGSSWALDDPRACQLKGELKLEATDVVTPTKGSDQWFCVRKMAGPDGKSYKLELKGVWWLECCWQYGEHKQLITIYVPLFANSIKCSGAPGVD